MGIYTLQYESYSRESSHQAYNEVRILLDKTKKYQQKEARSFLPSDTRFGAEMLYNRMNFTRPLAMFSLTIGILSFFLYCWKMAKQRNSSKKQNSILLAMLGIVFIYLMILIGLRGFIGGHLPMSNGYETMQLMSVCAILLTFLLYRKFEAAISFGYILCGLTLLVSMFGESNPSVTQLMPVLSSPLLSIHVVTIMLSYSLLAFVMLNGITAIILRYTRTDCMSKSFAYKSSATSFYIPLYSSWQQVSLLEQSGQTYHGEDTGDGIPKKYGHSSPCWYMQPLYILHHFPLSDARCSSTGLQ